MNTLKENTIEADIAFVRLILPDHYEVKESNHKGSIHCKSAIGIRKSPYNNDILNRPRYAGGSALYNTIRVTDAEDEEHWELIFKAIKQHFGERFQEVYHNTCFCHLDFTVYLKV